MNQVQQRIAAVATSRNRYLNIIRTITVHVFFEQ